MFVVVGGPLCAKERGGIRETKGNHGRSVGRSVQGREGPWVGVCVGRAGGRAASGVRGEPILEGSYDAGGGRRGGCLGVD